MVGTAFVCKDPCYFGSKYNYRLIREWQIEWCVIMSSSSPKSVKTYDWAIIGLAKEKPLPMRDFAWGPLSYPGAGRKSKSLKQVMIVLDTALTFNWVASSWIIQTRISNCVAAYQNSIRLSAACWMRAHSILCYKYLKTKTVLQHNMYGLIFPQEQQRQCFGVSLCSWMVFPWLSMILKWQEYVWSAQMFSCGAHDKVIKSWDFPAVN